MDNGSAETSLRHTAGTDGARPKHGALAHREYGLLAPAGTAVDPADTGDPSSKTGHGATGGQDGREPEEEGDETQQRAAITESDTRQGDPPNGRMRLTRAADKGGSPCLVSAIS